MDPRVESTGSAGHDGDGASLWWRVAEESAALLSSLEAVVKGRANLIRSCQEIASFGEDERARLPDLLRLVTEQRKRLRLLRRLWLGLAGVEQPPEELLAATQAVVAECRACTEALVPLRSRSLAMVEDSLTTTWDALSSVIPEDAPQAARAGLPRSLSA